jgi:hypothetical protein
VNETFRWQGEPVGNNSATPLGKLNLLFGSGTATPTETGLSISSKGQITFVAGQTFPSTVGSVTSVGLTAPASDFTVTGSPVKTSGTLNFAWNVAPTNAATAKAIVKRDSSGSFSAGSITASLGVSGYSTVVGIYGESNGTVSGDNGVEGVTYAGPGSGVAESISRALQAASAFTPRVTQESSVTVLLMDSPPTATCSRPVLAVGGSKPWYL